MNVKFIASKSVREFESKINNFIVGKVVKDIKYQTKGDHLTALILYREGY